MKLLRSVEQLFCPSYNIDSKRWGIRALVEFLRGLLGQEKKCAAVFATKKKEKKNRYSGLFILYSHNTISGTILTFHASLYRKQRNSMTKLR